MDLILGGAYQGKLSYARERFGLTDGDIFTCSEHGGIDFSLPCVYKLEEFTLKCARDGSDPTEFFKARRDEWENSVLICQDISCGVVPMGADMRLWRELTGSLCSYLSQRANSVTRLFYGIPQRLK